MLCRSCKKNVESSMKHAITANSCPFCGNAIFDANEFTFRKSIARVLIKNGLESEEQINKIVDDVLALASGTERVEDTQNATETPVLARPAVVVSASPSDPEAAKAKARALAAARAAGLDDGLSPAERNAPSRVLTPAPKPTAQMGEPGVDHILACPSLRAKEWSRPVDCRALMRWYHQFAERHEDVEAIRNIR